MTNVERTTRVLAGAIIATAALAATGVSAACKECGIVTAVKTVKKEGEGSGLGAVAGGVVGGVLGHQIGSGRGNDLATVAGAGAGAYAGHQIEKHRKSTTTYRVVVKMEGGATRTFNYANPTGYKVGDKVKVVGKKLTRR